MKIKRYLCSGKGKKLVLLQLVLLGHAKKGSNTISDAAPFLE